MVQITAGFLLAAWILYVIARGDLARLLWIVGIGQPKSVGDLNKPYEPKT